MATVTRTETLQVKNIHFTVDMRVGEAEQVTTSRVRLSWDCVHCDREPSGHICPHCKSGQDVNNVTELSAILGSDKAAEIRKTLLQIVQLPSQTR